MGWSDLSNLTSVGLRVRVTLDPYQSNLRPISHPKTRRWPAPEAARAHARAEKAAMAAAAAVAEAARRPAAQEAGKRQALTVTIRTKSPLPTLTRWPTNKGISKVHSAVSKTH